MKSVEGEVQCGRAAYTQDRNICPLGAYTPSIYLLPRRGKYTRVYTIVYLRVHNCIHTCTQHRSKYVPYRALPGTTIGTNTEPHQATRLEPPRAGSDIPPKSQSVEHPAGAHEPALAPRVSPLCMRGFSYICILNIVHVSPIHHYIKRTKDEYILRPTA